MQTGQTSFFRRFARIMGWTRSSYYLMSAFLATVFLIAYIWWPLAQEALSYVDWQGPWWLYFDWLLVGIFLVMSMLIMAGADLKADVWIVGVGLIGGLVIESWGTQTEIWWYYTAERPPLWIIPAWPIASLSIDRLVRLSNRWAHTPTNQLNWIVPRTTTPRAERLPRWVINLYWLVFVSFFVLMLSFVWPTLDRSLTLMALLLVGFLTLTPTDHRIAIITFLAGAGLGYFLEYWGTTRECWTYYTMAKPPLFAVFAHGMAAVAFWRTSLTLRLFSQKLFKVPTTATLQPPPGPQQPKPKN
jgi:hypothetical protein